MVARLVAPAVVELLEVIDVRHDQRQRLSGVCRVAHQAHDLGVEGLAVFDARQRVEHRFLLDVLDVPAERHDFVGRFRQLVFKPLIRFADGLCDRQDAVHQRADRRIARRGALQFGRQEAQFVGIAGGVHAGRFDHVGDLHHLVFKTLDEIDDVAREALLEDMRVIKRVRVALQHGSVRASRLVEVASERRVAPL